MNTISLNHLKFNYLKSNDLRKHVAEWYSSDFERSTAQYFEHVVEFGEWEIKPPGRTDEEKENEVVTKLVLSMTNNEFPNTVDSRISHNLTIKQLKHIAITCKIWAQTHRSSLH